MMPYEIESILTLFLLTGFIGGAGIVYILMKASSDDETFGESDTDAAGLARTLNGERK